MILDVGEPTTLPRIPRALYFRLTMRHLNCPLGNPLGFREGGEPTLAAAMKRRKIYY